MSCYLVLLCPNIQGFLPLFHLIEAYTHLALCNDFKLRRWHFSRENRGFVLSSAENDYLNQKIRKLVLRFLDIASLILFLFLILLS